MDNNNPYKRSFKTKREEYQEKLKQKNSNQEWIFDNYFGKPGGGAPLRDNQGNVITTLKSASQTNLHIYEPDYFSRGNNNISVLNNKIYNQNNLISTPLSQTYGQTNKLSLNENNSYQNKRTVSAINQNIYNNNNLLIQNQMPYKYTIPYSNIIQYNPMLPIQLQNQNILNNNIYNQNYNNINNNIISNINRNNTSINSQMNNLNYNQSNNIISSNNINSNYNNLNNSQNLNNISGKQSLINNNNNENDLFISNDLNNKAQNEKKLEQWKNDLKKQMEDKKKRDLEEKKAMAQREKDEIRKYKEYLIYKNKQAEEQNKKNKLYKQQYLNRNNINNNIFDMPNDYEQANQSMNDMKNKDNEMVNPYDINNTLNEYDIPPEVLKEQEKFKNFIDKQYESLGETLGQSIQNEVAKMASMLTNKYEPYKNSDNINNFKDFKLNNEAAARNEKKMQKMQDIIEERDLLDFIIGQRDTFSPFKYKNYDLVKYSKINNEVPSFFGKNIVPYEKEYENLKTNNDFIFGDFTEKSRAKEYKSIFSQEEYEQEQQKQNDDYNYGNEVNNNNINNNQNYTFGNNKDRNNVMESIAISQSLDNKSSFIPINKDVDPKMIEEINKNINGKRDEYIKEEIIEPKINIKERKLRDRVEENIIKNLNEINTLNKNIILYDKDDELIQNFINSSQHRQINSSHHRQIKNDIKEKEFNKNENNNEIKEENKEIKNGENNDIKNIEEEKKENQENQENDKNKNMNEENEKKSVDIGIQSNQQDIENASKKYDLNLKNNTIESDIVNKSGNDDNDENDKKEEEYEESDVEQNNE